MTQQKATRMDKGFRLAVNTSIFDGYDLETALASIKKCGFNFFELAYNQGYVGNLNQDLFGVENGNNINKLKEKYQLSVLALGCTMDLSSDNFLEIFSPRLRFAQLIGAKYINVCTAKRENKDKMICNLKSLRPILEETGCILCLENGGDYNFNAFITLEEGIELLNELGDDVYSINFDPGNMVTYDKNLDVVAQSIKSLDYVRYFHIKDVCITGEKFRFIPVEGRGLINYQEIIYGLKQRGIPCSFEIPLRIYRELDSTPRRFEKAAELAVIENTLIKSREYVETIPGNINFERE
ncbi:sugar phosphate isomerase/epimerase family protein [Basfia succiniciproducens]|uniref:Sugar phosphate isomerase/epimerase n=1 Tax=Basfia succiniciproducens TaxID=653940 RepID=A0A1G5AAG9_9PAST|nr:sugar phosphate isomerase/epimerase family protein [Basfia succiniciproducens]SCX74867.1 Sugar phosphate isomerase/epimerase [Basfia succiniciproducens]